MSDQHSPSSNQEVINKLRDALSLLVDRDLTYFGSTVHFEFGSAKEASRVIQKAREILRETL